MKAIFSKIVGLFQYREVSIVKQKLTPSRVPELETWPDLPLVSIVVAAWNEASHIDSFLKSFTRIGYPNRELIIVAGGEDDTWQKVADDKNPHLTLLEQQSGEGKFGALKKGFQQANGSIVFLTDADCVLDSESFNRLIFAIVSDDEDAVTGRVQPLVHQLSRPFVLAQAVFLWRRMLLVPDPRVDFLIGANCALKRSLLDHCLDLASDQPIGEDYFLALSIRRSGHNIIYHQDSVVETRFPLTFGEYVRQKSRWHRSYILLHFQFGDQRWISNVLTGFLNLILLILPLLAFFLGYLGLLAWLLSWSISFIPYLKARRLAIKLGLSPVARLIDLLKHMLADFTAWAICLPQLVLKHRRGNW